MRISLDEPVFHQCRARQRDLGDGHGSARADFAQILAMLREAPWKVNGIQQLIGGQRVCL